MATVAKTSITADTSNIVDGQAIDAGDVVVPIEDNRDSIREGRVAAIGTATHVGTLDDVITVTAPVVKSVTSPTGDARLNLDVDDMTGATGVSAGARGLVPEPAAGDENKVLRGDGTWASVAGTGTVTSVDATQGLTTNTGSAFTSSGTVHLNIPMCGVRMSLLSGSAVPSSDQSAKTAIYLEPFTSNRVAVYSGSRWKLLAAPATAFSIVSLDASSMYDVFAYDNAGALDLEFGKWSTSGFGTSSRATALTTQDGVLVKSGDASRLYMGSVYINSTGGQTDDTALKRYLWNQYNRVPRRLRVADTTNSWTYSSGAWRMLNNSSSNRVEFVQGVLYEKVQLTHLNYPSGAFASVGIDLNAATDGGTGLDMMYGGNSTIALAYYNNFAAVGLNYLQLMEYGSVSGPTFQGDSGVSYGLQTGASGEVFA